MKSKLFFTCLLSLMAIGLCAQINYDIIFLKDGSIYRGHVSEYLPNDHVTMKLMDDRIITVQSEQIMKMTVGKDVVVRKRFDVKSKGYFHNSLLGLQFGNAGHYITTATFAYNTVNGYRINNHHMGLGLGIEHHIGNWYVPLYADYSFHFLKGRTSPVLGINGGFMLPLRNEFRGQNDYSKGNFIGGRVGVVAYSNPHFAILVNLTYRYINLNGSEYVNQPWWGEWQAVTGAAELHRVGLMLGFVIN